MDLSHFQFDFDLSFAVLFMDADLTIYGRFGTRSDRPEEQDISLQGLARRWPSAAAASRRGRRQAGAGGQAGEAVAVPDAAGLSQPLGPVQGRAGLCRQRREELHPLPPGPRRRAPVYRSAGERFPDEVLYPYPDPEVVGLKLDPEEMARSSASPRAPPADRDGFRPGDEVVSLDGQPLLSIADFQWVLHNAPAAANCRPGSVAAGRRST